MKGKFSKTGIALVGCMLVCLILFLAVGVPNGFFGDGGKGGDLDEEIAACTRRWHLDPARFYQAKISAWFDDPWFEEKKIVVIK